MPGVTILDYQYKKGDKVIVGVSPSIKSSTGYDGVQGLSSTGGYERGDSLFVEWKVTATGETFKETIDLTKILPLTLKDKKLFFVVEPYNLNIYIAGPTDKDDIRCVELRPALRQPRQADLVAKAKYCNQSLLKIYPNKIQLLN